MTLPAPSVSALWGRARATLHARRMPVAARLEVQGIEPDPAQPDGEVWTLLAEDDDMRDYCDRYRHRIAQTLSLETRRPCQVIIKVGTVVAASAAPLPAPGEPPGAPPASACPAPPDASDDGELDLDLPDDSPEMERLVQQARAGAVQGEALAGFGVRNKRWRYAPLGNYEAIFWLAFLGPRLYCLWSSLRAWMDCPVMADPPTVTALATLATGSEGNRRLVTGYQPEAGSAERGVEGLLPALRALGLVDWRGDGDAREYAVLSELPLLTPKQVATLPPALQDHHRRWLRQYEIYRQWARIRAASLVPPLSLGAEKVIAFRRRSA